MHTCPYLYLEAHDLVDLFLVDPFLGVLVYKHIHNKITS